MDLPLDAGVEVFATRALTFWTVGVARAETLNGGRFDGSS